MAIDFRNLSLAFDSAGGGEQHETGEVEFNSTVIKAQAMLNGFDVKMTMPTGSSIRSRSTLARPRTVGG